jgi:hypothetical protein
LRIDKASFSEVLSQSDPFREIIQLYIQALFSQIAQQVACNALHSIEERCCRWLLLTHDRVHTDTSPLTHEFLAQMLGVRRASVTLAAGALQAAGLIATAAARWSSSTAKASRTPHASATASCATSLTGSSALLHRAAITSTDDKPDLAPRARLAELNNVLGS